MRFALVVLPMKPFLSRANKTPSLQVLQAMQGKSFLEAQAVTEIEEVLKERYAAANDVTQSPLGANGDGVTDLDDMPPSQTLPKPRRGGAGSSAAASGSAPRLDRKQVEQRIEEDRERHKRLRESIWAVPATDNAELQKLWEETSDLGDDDHLMGEEEYEEHAKTVMMSCPHRAGGGAEANGKHSH